MQLFEEEIQIKRFLAMLRRQRLGKMQLIMDFRTATGVIAALFLLFVIQQADLSTFSGVSMPESGNLPSAQKSALTRKHFHGCHRIFLQSFHAALIN